MQENNKYDVVIIGSGPAGNTAGIYTVRSGFKTAIFTGNSIGGQLTITTDVENFPCFPEPIKGLDLMNRALKQSENLGVDIIYDSIKNIDFSKKPFVLNTENDKVIYSNNVIIATGAKAKWLGLESEKKFLGFGVSGCATCDGNFFKNLPVAIIGGGDTAGTEAIHMSNIASKVYVIYRKSSFVRMQDALAKKILNNDKIEVLFNSEVVEVCGNEKPKSVEYLKVLNNKTNKIDEVKVNAMFLAIGREPESNVFKDSGLNIDSDGYIITEKDSARTNIANVYVAGDVSNKKYKQAVIAAGYGSIAALELEEDNNK